VSIVEEALRSQATAWRDVAERVSAISNREFPSEAPKRILVFGVGSSHMAAKLIGYTLSRDKSRPRLPVIACSSMAIGSEVVPAKGDWCFAISHRGRTVATLAALEACQRANSFTVLVSAKGTVAPASAQLLLETSELEQCEPHTISMTSAVCAVSTHFLGAKAKEEWELMGSLGAPGLEVMQRRVGKGPAVIVGEWEGEWLAREGALKLMEMARLPVRAFGSEEYFHGPHYSVRPEDPIWYVSHVKDLRGTELKSAYRFDIHGSNPLAWVPTLVEIQWAALAVATNLGIDPDVPQVPGA
jgi:fructoselysine-6-P-deglycase FrlB-like protein